MATYHVRMSVGNGGKAAAHFKYIERTGKYRRHAKGTFSSEANRYAPFATGRGWGFVEADREGRHTVVIGLLAPSYYNRKQCN